MKRVLVIGCPGAGKTTFAIELAKLTGLPLIHLDYYYHDKTKDYYNERNKPAWLAKVRDLMEGDKWIMDGNYSSTFAERFKKADTIIFFDFPRRTRILGIFKRRLQYRNKARQDMPLDWDERIRWDFFKFVWNFEQYRPRIINVIDSDSSKKLLVFKNRADANLYLGKLETSVE
jgi:adenylate kinase family enzyme